MVNFKLKEEARKTTGMNKTYAIIRSHKTANNSSIIHSISHTKQKQRTRKYNHELLLEEQIMFKVFLEGGSSR